MLRVYYKYASSEPASYSLSSISPSNVTLAAYRGVRPDYGVQHVSGNADTATGTNRTLTNRDLGMPMTVVGIWGAIGAGTWTAPSGWNSRNTNTHSDNTVPDILVADADFTASTGDVTASYSTSVTRSATLAIGLLAADTAIPSNTVYWKGGAEAVAAASSAATTSVPIPTTVSDGDLMVLAAHTRSTVGISTPAGWTLTQSALSGTEATASRLYVFTKIASAEGSSVSVTASENSVARLYSVQVFGGVDAADPIILSNSAIDATGDTSMDLPSITTTAAPNEVVGIWGGTWSTTTEYGSAPLPKSPGPWNMREVLESGESSNEQLIVVASRYRGTTGAETGNITVGTAPEDEASVILALRPASVTVLLAGPIGTGEAFGGPSYSATVTASMLGVASGEAFTGPTHTAVVTASLLGIASAEALGKPSNTGTVTATTLGIATAEALGNPTPVPTLTAAMAGIASGELFGGPSHTAALTYLLSGISSAEAVPGPAGYTIGWIIQALGIASAEAAGSPTVVPGPTSMGMQGIASGELFGAVTHAIRYYAGGIASGEALGGPSLTGRVTVQALGVSSSELVGGPSFVPGGTSMALLGIASGEAVGGPTPAPGAVAVLLLGVASAEALGRPTHSASVSVPTLGIASGEVLGAPALSWSQVLGALGIASGEVLGRPSFATAVSLALLGVASAEAAGAPTPIPGPVSVAVQGKASDETHGSPTVLPGPVAVLVSSTVSAEAFGLVAYFIVGRGSPRASLRVAPAVEAVLTVAPVGLMEVAAAADAELRVAPVAAARLSVQRATEPRRTL